MEPKSSLRGVVTTTLRTMEQVLNDILIQDNNIKAAQNRKQALEQELVAMHTRLTEDLKARKLIP